MRMQVVLVSNLRQQRIRWLLSICFDIRASTMRTKQKNLSLGEFNVVEPLLVGIVMGLIPITLAGLFFAAYMQYKRGDQLGINK